MFFFSFSLTEIWHATRFALKKLDVDFKPAERSELHPHATKIDQWILSRLSNFVQKVNEGFESLSFSTATTYVLVTHIPFSSLFHTY